MSTWGIVCLLHKYLTIVYELHTCSPSQFIWSESWWSLDAWVMCNFVITWKNWTHSQILYLVSNTMLTSVTNIRNSSTTSQLRHLFLSVVLNQFRIVLQKCWSRCTFSQIWLNLEIWHWPEPDFSQTWENGQISARIWAELRYRPKDSIIKVFLV